MSHRVVIFGTSAFGVPAFNTVLHDPKFEIVAVVTQPAKPTGRHQQLRPTPVAIWAEENDLPVETPTSLKKPEIITKLSELKPDLFLVTSYGLILPQVALDVPARGSMNIHASLLPKYRGASPISAAIVNGDRETGLTFMLMDAGCDTGPMLIQISCPIAPDDTRQILEQRLSEMAAKNVLPALAGWLDQTIAPQPQPSASATVAPKISRADGLATWDNAGMLQRKILALQPWPGVWTTWNGLEMKILSATAEHTAATEPGGTIVRRGDRWSIACDNGYLTPATVQFAGKKPQAAKQVPGSYPGFIGSRLG